MAYETRESQAAVKLAKINEAFLLFAFSTALPHKGNKTSLHGRDFGCMRSSREQRRLQQLALKGDEQAAQELGREGLRRGDDTLVRFCAWVLTRGAEEVTVSINGVTAPLIGWSGVTCLSAPLQAQRRMVKPFDVELIWTESKANQLACVCIGAMFDLFERKKLDVEKLLDVFTEVRHASLRDEISRYEYDRVRAVKQSAKSKHIQSAASAVQALMEAREGAPSRFANATLISARATSLVALSQGKPQLAARHIDLRWQRARLLDHILLDCAPDEVASIELN